MPETYEIKRGLSYYDAGNRTWWSVIAYRGDECLGGDWHWLSRDLAEQAKAAYEAGTAKHGESLPADITAVQP